MTLVGGLAIFVGDAPAARVELTRFGITLTNESTPCPTSELPLSMMK
jgi:hypothetical protein